MAIGPRFSRFRTFGTHYRAIRDISKSICYEKGVTAKLFHLLVSQVTSVTLIHHMHYSFWVYLLVQQQVLFMCLEPVYEWVAIGWLRVNNFFKVLSRHLDESQSAHLCKPIPEFWKP